MTLANDGSAESGWVNDPYHNVDVWRYGTERACRLDGQYVTIVADFSGEAGSYEKALCALGVFGNYLEEAIVNIEQETNTVEQQE